MKKVTVRLSNAQAARIDSIAKMMKMPPGDLLASITFGELGNSGFGDARTVVYFIGVNRDLYIKRRKVSGENIEIFLRAGLAKTPLRKFLKLIDQACNDDKKAGDALAVFEPAT